jgi:acid phosphatase
MNPRVRIIVPAALASLLALTALPAAGSESGRGDSALSRISHIVVIYQENHSFDNLYGSWEGVNGLSQADAEQTIQMGQNGVAYTCLKQNEPLLAAALPKDCVDTTTGTTFTSHFTNAPFTIDSYIPSTMPTEDLVHRYYQEQYQLNGGQQNRYVTGSDAIGLTMGVYHTQDLPIYKYLHQPGHPAYAIADKFFQASFGGSFLNHQWLVAAATPIFAGAANDGGPNDRHSVVDANGMPANAPLYTSPLGGAVKDFNLTASCNPPTPIRPATPPGVVCGDFAVNTTQPMFQPYFPNTAAVRRLPPLTNPNIGDALNAKGVDWAWYSGGWDNAAGNTTSPYYTNGPGPTCSDPNTIKTTPPTPYPYCPDYLFQFHHQAFNYFAEFDPSTAAGKAARAAHLRDEKEFLQVANSSTSQCNLKPVSFVKPIGEENEHPGYTNESRGSQHLADLLTAIEGSACKNNTLVVATYDEFGGFWDHVSPPGQGDNEGVSDKWGPGTRVPALIVAPGLQSDFVVDRASHDTTSILATIEHRFGLPPLGTRDASVKDLSSVFRARASGDDGGGDQGGSG